MNRLFHTNFVGEKREELDMQILPARKIIRIIAIILILVLSFAWFSLSSKASAVAGINKTINFQGKLTNPDGTNVADNTYSIVFTLYDDPSAGSNLWDETQSVTVTDGIFHVELGTVDTTLGNVNFNSDTIYLGIKVGADTEMTPRVRFNAVPYAFNAQKVNGLTVTNTSDNPFSSATTLKLPDGNTYTIASPNSGSTDTIATLTSASTLTNKTIGSTGLTFSGASTDITTTSGESLTLEGAGAGIIVLNDTVRLAGFSVGSVVFSGSNGDLSQDNTNFYFDDSLNKLYIGAGPRKGVLEAYGNGIGNAAFIVDQRDSNAQPDVFSASASGSTVFTVDYAGNTKLAGGTTVDTLSNGTLGIGTSNATTITVGRSGQNINLAKFTNNNNSVLYTGASGALGVAETTGTGECLVSNGGSAAPSWGSCAGIATLSWQSLTAPTSSNLSLNMTTYTTTFDWATGTGSNNLFNLTTANSSNGTGYLLNVATGTSSTVKPLHISAAGVEAVMVDASGNVGVGTTSVTSGYKLDVTGAVRVTGNLALTGLSGGSVPFIGANNIVSQDNTNFFWNDTTKKLFIGSEQKGVVNISGNGTNNAALIINQSDSTAQPNILAASASGTTKFIIDYGGNVGVGTTTTASKVTVANGTDTSGNFNALYGTISNHPITLMSTYGSGGGFGGIAWGTGDNNATKPKAAIWAFGDGNGSEMHFGVSNAYATGITHVPLSIVETGYVGISNLVPALSLEVGDITRGVDAANGVGIQGDLEVEDFALLNAVRIGTTATDPGDGAFYVEGNSQLNGNLGIGVASASDSWVKLGANTTTKANINIAASSAVDVSSPNIGDLWFNGTNLNFRKDGSTTIDLLSTTASAVSWQGITAPTSSNLSLNMTTYTTTFDWATGTGSNNLFNLTTANSSNGTGYLLNVATGTSSTVNPFRVAAAGVEAMVVNSSGNVGVGTTSPVNGKLEVAGADGVDAILALSADRSDDNGDTWQVRSLASGNSLSILTDTSGSFVEVMNLTTAGLLQIDSNITVSGGTVTGANSELINIGQADNGSITFTGAGETNNNSFTVDLETVAAYPVLNAGSDTQLGIDEDLIFVGQQTISTSDGSDLLFGSGNDVNFQATGGSTGDPDLNIAGYFQANGTAEFNGTVQIDSTLDINSADGTDFANSVTFNDDVDLVLAGSENLTIGNTTLSSTSNTLDLSATITGNVSANLLNMVITNNSGAGTNYGLSLTNADNGGNTAVIDALAILSNDQATETIADGLIVRHNAGSGVLTNGLKIENTTAGGTISTALNIVETAGTITTGINIGTVTTGISIGATTTAISLASGSTTDLSFLDSSPVISIADNGTLTINDGTNALLTLADSSNTGNLGITGDLTVTGNDISFGNLESISNTTNGTITLGRNDAGTVTLTTKDDDATAAFSILSGGASTLTLDTGGGAALNIGNTNATSLVLGSTTNTTTTTYNSSATTGTGATSAFVFNTTNLTSGTGLQFTTGNPQANNNSGTLSSGKVLNVSSANHTYMSLDNRELTIGGHKNNITISSVTDVFFYDTTSDMDGGKWTDGARAQNSSWYSETKDATGAACDISTMDRCGSSEFPNKAIIVTNATTVYIFDAKDNTMWMKFSKGSGATEQMIGPTTNSTVSTVFALNGKIYVGNNGSVGGLYQINFLSDIAKKYNSTDDYQSNVDIVSRNSTTTWYSSVGTPLVGTVINDVHGAVVNGKVYIGVALEPTNASANGSISIIDETDQTVINFGIAANNTASKHVFITNHGDLYATIGNATTISGSTNYFLKAKHNLGQYTASQTNLPFSEIYGNVGTSSTQYGISMTDAAFGSVSFTNGPSPIDATFVPQSLFVTQGTSNVNGKSNTIYVGTTENLTVFQEKQSGVIGTMADNSVKYFTTTFITEQQIGDARLMLPLVNTLAATTLITGADQSVKANAFTTTAAATVPTQNVSGVRDVGMSFDGGDQICTGTVAGTCADDADLDFASGASFSVGAWVKQPSSAAIRTIVAKASAVNGVGYKLYLDASDNFCFGVDTAAGAFPETSACTSGIAFDDNGWHHVVGVKNAGTSLQIYVDGILRNTSGAPVAATLDNAGALRVGMDADGTTNGSTATIDEVFLTAEALTAVNVKAMYRLGWRALNNHTSDTLQELAGSSNQVNAVTADLEGGTIYAGTAGGGVTVIGNDTDSQITTYTNAGGPSDDLGSSFANDTINSISVSRGYGVGNALVIGNGSGAWIETEDTTVKDFLSQSYNPLGLTLTQSNLNVDNVFRVTNQLSTRLDNLAAFSSPQVGLYEQFRVDTQGTFINNTLKIDNNTNFGGYGIGGAFISRNSQFMDEFMRFRATLAADTTGAAGAGFGDYANWGAYVTGTCSMSTPVTDTVNGIIQLATSANNSGCAILTDEALNNYRGLLDVDNLPIILMKVKPSLVSSTFFTYVGMSDATDGIIVAPTNFVGFTNDNAGTGGTTWKAVTRSASTSTTLSCSGQGTDTISTTQFALLMIEVRANNDIHFYMDADVSNGVNLQECGNGSSTNIPNPAANLAPDLSYQQRGAGSGNLQVDFYRFWQDDAPGLETADSTGIDLENETASTDAQLIASAAEVEESGVNQPVVLNTNGEDVVVKDTNGKEVAVLTSFGDARFKGVLEAAGLSINNETGDATIKFDNSGNATFAGTLKADKIYANQILGLEYLQTALETNTTRVASLESLVAHNNSSDSAVLGESTDESVAGKVLDTLRISGILEVLGDALFKAPARFIKTVIFDSVVEFFDTAIFHKNVKVEGELEVSNDTAGYVVIKKGQTVGNVVFEHPYESQPVVNASMLVVNLSEDVYKGHVESGECLDTDGVEECQNKISQILFESNIRHIIRNQTKLGFSIVINIPAPVDITFSWQALGNKNPERTVSELPHDLVMPFRGNHAVTSKFGERVPNAEIAENNTKEGLQGHDGVDFGMPEGTPISAVDDGVVVPAAGDLYGTTVVIKHTWGKSFYGHLSSVSVEEGQQVKKGETIGLSGNTGLSTAPHLHFSLKLDTFDQNNGYLGKINPMDYLPRVERASFSLQPTIPMISPTVMPSSSTVNILELLTGSGTESGVLIQQ